MGVETYWDNRCQHHVNCFLGTVSICRPGKKPDVIDVYLYPMIDDPKTPNDIGVCVRFGHSVMDVLPKMNANEFTQYLLGSSLAKFAAPLGYEAMSNWETLKLKMPKKAETCFIGTTS